MHNAEATLFPLLFSALFASAAVAQSPLYLDVTTSHLPAGLAGACMNVAAGDADGDGDSDLALAMEFQQNLLLLNDGRGRFSNATARLPVAEHDSEDVEFADFDGDGDNDLVFVSEDDKTDEFYLNDGQGNFSDASAQLKTDDVSNDLAVMDINDDGLPDVLTGNIGIDRVLVSDGKGGFRDETTQRWSQSGDSRTQDIEVADLDGDGDSDVVVGNEGPDQLFLNEDGVLRDVTATALPASNDETRKIEALDADGDGDVDLLVGNVQFGMEESAQDYLLLNDGSAVFTRAEESAVQEDGRSNFVLQTVDLDRDGDLDAIAPSTVFPANDIRFVMMSVDRDGNPLMVRADEIFFVDSDGDDDLDARVTVDERQVLFISADGRFTPSEDISAWTDVNVLAPRDFSADGRDDVLSGEIAFTTSRVKAVASIEIFRSESLQVVDADRDGDIDAMLPFTQSMAAIGDYLVLLNDGAGHFIRAEVGAVLPDGGGLGLLKSLL
ncbi:MAG: VCBS repeat-containing protein, partial [Pseudomonadota bacterium]